MSVPLHAPPGTASDKVSATPMHVVDAPVIIPASGCGLIAMPCFAIAVPHILVTEYLIVSTPCNIPVTTPPETVAAVLSELHIPPPMASDITMVFPMHTLPVPDIMPA